MYRIFLLSAAGIALISAALILWISSASYYPVVHAVFPDHSELVFIDMPWTEQKKCLDFNATILSSLRANCAGCSLTGSCENNIEASWKQALAGRAIGQLVVHAGTQRIVVRAGAASRQICIDMAEQITRAKKQKARCVG